MPPPVTVRRAPYKDFLQPALHRRFTTTAAAVAICAYFESLLVGRSGSWLWWLFPLSTTGIRAFFITLCGLALIINRIAQYHIGLRTTNSGGQTLIEIALERGTYETLVVYAASGWLFSQIYLWSIPASSEQKMQWIWHANGERIRLNENVVFFTTCLVLFGISQAALHLHQDFDRLALGSVRRHPKTDTQPKFETPDPLRRFALQLFYLLPRSLKHIGLPFAAITVAYFWLVRPLAWRLALACFRPFYQLPKTNMLPLSTPLKWAVIYHCLFAGSLCWLLWMVGNTAFSVFLVNEPLKNGRPLTSDSKDPNGSLLNGLKSKKESIKGFALWELAYIARDFEDRRKAIYDDLDRRDGPMWTQVHRVCIETISSLGQRIDDFQRPPVPAAAAQSATAVSSATNAGPGVKTAVRNEPVVATTPVKSSVGTELKRVLYEATNSPNQPSRISPRAKKALADVKGRIAGVQQQITSPELRDDGLQNTARSLIHYWPVTLLRQSWRRRLAAVVLGRPYGEPSIYINAATALSLLATHSLQEDKYGNVQRDIANIIRTFTASIQKINAFKSGLTAHWTDMRSEKVCPEVEEVLDTLREALFHMTESFAPYARDLRLSRVEMRQASEAAAGGAREQRETQEAQATARVPEAIHEADRPRLENQPQPADDRPEMIEAGPRQRSRLNRHFSPVDGEELPRGGANMDGHIYDAALSRGTGRDDPYMMRGALGVVH